MMVAGHEVLQGELLADGGFAQVYAGSDARSGQQLAIRRTLLQDAEAVEAARAEIQLLERISSHPHIVRFFGAEVFGNAQSAQGACSAQEAVSLFEFCPGGTLLSHLEQTLIAPRRSQCGSSCSNTKPVLPGCCPCLDEAKVLDVLGGMSAALAHLHQLAIIHYDVKSESLTLGSDGRWKLGDFGSASDRTFELRGAPRKLLLEAQEFVRGRCTPFYRAPEVADVQLRWPIGPKVDIFASGCVLFAAVSGRHPFPTDSALANIQARFLLPPEAEVAYAPALSSWARRLLAREPHCRPTAPELAAELEAFRAWGREPLEAAALGRELLPIQERGESGKSTEALEETDSAGSPGERAGPSQDTSFDALRFALRSSMAHAESAIERQRAEAHERTQKLRTEWEQLCAERDRVEAQRASLQAQQASLQLEHEEVCRIRVELEAQRRSGRPRDFWTCCMCPITDKPIWSRGRSIGGC